MISHGFFDELEKTSNKQQISNILSKAGLAAVLGSGVYAGYLTNRHIRNLKREEEKLSPLLNVPVGGKLYNPSKDVKRAEKEIGKKIKVIDLSRVSRGDSLEYLGMEPTEARQVLQGNAAAVLVKPIEYMTNVEEAGKTLEDPAIAIHPSVTKETVHHELGHIIDAHKRVTEGKRSTRSLSDEFGERKKERGYKKGEDPTLLDEKAAWNQAKKLWGGEYGKLRRPALKTYQHQSDYKKKMKVPAAIGTAGAVSSAAGVLLGLI